MEKIKNVVIKGMELDSQLIIEILEEVSDNGDIMIIKSDGLRDSLKYSVVISSCQSKFLPIRFDADNLSSAVLKAVNEYYKSANVPN